MIIVKLLNNNILTQYLKDNKNLGEYAQKVGLLGAKELTKEFLGLCSCAVWTPGKVEKDRKMCWNHGRNTHLGVKEQNKVFPSILVICFYVANYPPNLVA